SIRCFFSTRVNSSPPDRWPLSFRAGPRKPSYASVGTSPGMSRPFPDEESRPNLKELSFELSSPPPIRVRSSRLRTKPRRKCAISALRSVRSRTCSSRWSTKHQKKRPHEHRGSPIWRDLGREIGTWASDPRDRWPRASAPCGVGYVAGGRAHVPRRDVDHYDQYRIRFADRPALALDL